eukprot:3941017-Rhodomonas_salina.2
MGLRSVLYWLGHGTTACVVLTVVWCYAAIGGRRRRGSGYAGPTGAMLLCYDPRRVCYDRSYAMILRSTHPMLLCYAAMTICYAPMLICRPLLLSSYAMLLCYAPSRQHPPPL